MFYHLQPELCGVTNPRDPTSLNLLEHHGEEEVAHKGSPKEIKEEPRKVESVWLGSGPSGVIRLCETDRNPTSLLLVHVCVSG